MRKLGTIFALILVMSMVLAACASPGDEGAEGTPGLGTETFETEVPGGGLGTAVVTETPSLATTEPVVTAEPTLGVTEPAGTPAGTAVLPSTGAQNPTLVSTLLDYNVRDSNGEDMGEVGNMIINLDKQQVDYVIVDFGGFLGLGEKNVALPWDMLQINTGTNEDAGFTLTVDRTMLENAPDVDLGGLDLTNPDYDADFRDYWTTGGTGTTGTPEATVAATAAATAVATESVTTGTAQPGAGQPLTGAILAEDLLGYNVVDANGDDMGEVQDAIVDLGNGGVHYTVLAAGGALGIGEKWIPVPLSAYSRSAEDDNSFVLNVDKDTLVNAPNFDVDALPDTSVAGWDDQIRAYWADFVDTNWTNSNGAGTGTNSTTTP